MNAARGFRPVIIVGAPRSGTNMLRDALCKIPGWATWPCDEINYVWRHGNIAYPSDELVPAQVTPRLRRLVDREFTWVHRRYDAHTVVEKTCANSLRVPFVDAIVPDARYVFIVRSGIDAVGSAMHRWTAPSELGYLAAKARFVPPTDLPYYAARFVSNRLYRVFSRERRVAFWGPQMHDLQALLKAHPLDEVCALQWQRCVEASAEAFAAMPADRVVRVHYEDLVTAPAVELGRIVAALGATVELRTVERAAAAIGTASVGKGRQQLGAANVARLEALVGATLARCGYA